MPQRARRRRHGAAWHFLTLSRSDRVERRWAVAAPARRPVRGRAARPIRLTAVAAGATLIDLRDRASGGEQAFFFPARRPPATRGRRLFVTATNRDGDTRVEYSGARGVAADPATRAAARGRPAVPQPQRRAALVRPDGCFTSAPATVERVRHAATRIPGARLADPVRLLPGRWEPGAYGLRNPCASRGRRPLAWIATWGRQREEIDCRRAWRHAATLAGPPSRRHTTRTAAAAREAGGCLPGGRVRARQLLGTGGLLDRGARCRACAGLRLRTSAAQGGGRYGRRERNRRQAEDEELDRSPRSGIRAESVRSRSGGIFRVGGSNSTMFVRFPTLVWHPKLMTRPMPDPLDP